MRKPGAKLKRRGFNERRKKLRGRLRRKSRARPSKLKNKKRRKKKESKKRRKRLKSEHRCWLKRRQKMPKLAILGRC
jgi:hypothetical protein